MTTVKDYVSGLHFPHRGPCPSCGGINSFGADIVNGVIQYHCFRASCGIKGRIDYEITVDTIRNNSFSIFYNSPTESSLSIRPDETYKIPEYFTSPLQNATCYSYLNVYKLFNYYSKHVDRIKYDPRQYRCVFILKNHEGDNCGAVGRYLGKFTDSDTPRWHVYSRLQGCPFINVANPLDSNCILVEDCVSAINVAQAGYNSIALLGTSIPDETIGFLVRFNKFILALDPDANAKAIKLQHQLSAFRETNIITLSTDPKNFSQTQLKEIFKEL